MPHKSLLQRDYFLLQRDVTCFLVYEHKEIFSNTCSVAVLH